VNADIVVSTYATISAEYGRGVGDIYQMYWQRIVLDEAHSIRHRNTKQFRAVIALSGSFRWCLTGTPIQNSLYDLYSLAKFLRIPFLEDLTLFRDRIVRLVESNRPLGFTNLKNLLRCVCLRRTRVLANLPDPETMIHDIILSPEEQAEYYQIGEESKRTIDDIICGRKPMKEYYSILQTILQLRSLCNHGTHNRLISAHAQSIATSDEEALVLRQQADDAICLSCSVDVTTLNEVNGAGSGKFTPCKHLLCLQCYCQYEQDLSRNQTKSRQVCPLCQDTIPLTNKLESTITPSLSHYLSEDEINQGHCTKIRHLIENIRAHYESDKR
jgi:SWI/SNF-related matrix-associated actin-dependent regulator of chromatin subfamily A3